MSTGNCCKCELCRAGKVGKVLGTIPAHPWTHLYLSQIKNSSSGGFPERDGEEQISSDCEICIFHIYLNCASIENDTKNKTTIVVSYWKRNCVLDTITSMKIPHNDNRLRIAKAFLLGNHCCSSCSLAHLTWLHVSAQG